MRGASEAASFVSRSSRQVALLGGRPLSRKHEKGEASSLPRTRPRPSELSHGAWRLARRFLYSLIGRAWPDVSVGGRFQDQGVVDGFIRLIYQSLTHLASQLCVLFFCMRPFHSVAGLMSMNVT